MKLKTKQLAVIAIGISGMITLGSLKAKAQNSINVVTTAVPFLRIPPDARGGGMGDVGLATSPDANSGFWNLSKLVFADQKAALTATYIPWLKDLTDDMYLAALGGYYKFADDQAINVSLRYFNLGNLQFKDNQGNALQTFKPREFSIDAGYARKLSSKSSLALAVRYINSNLADKGVGGSDYKQGSSVAADLSYYYNAAKDNGEGWTFGAALTNLGAKIDYTVSAGQESFIPADLGLGTAYTKVFDEDNKMSFALDIHKLLVPTPPAADDSAGWVKYYDKSVVSSWFSSFGDAPDGFSEELKEFQLGLGVEYWYHNQFAVRAGYHHENKDKGGQSFFSAGLGVNYASVSLNAAYLISTGSGVEKNPLSNTLRVGLVLNLKTDK